MKIYTWQGEDYTKLPDPLMTEVGQISPVSEALFLELGGTISDDGEPTHWEELDAACPAVTYFIDEKFGGLKVLDEAPINALQLLLFDCDDQRLEDLIK